jgi:uncharacterized membrane protein YkvA (DUF1232 family)
MGLAVGMILGVLTIGSYAFGKVEAMGPNHQTRCPYSLSSGARPRVPWYAKVLAIAVAAYALSPIDLIPDFIPGIGYLDDLIIVPASIALVIRLIPPEIMGEHREMAIAAQDRPVGWVAAAAIKTFGL